MLLASNPPRELPPRSPNPPPGGPPPRDPPRSPEPPGGPPRNPPRSPEPPGGPPRNPPSPRSPRSPPPRPPNGGWATALTVSPKQIANAENRCVVFILDLTIARQQSSVKSHPTWVIAPPTIVAFAIATRPTNPSLQKVPACPQLFSGHVYTRHLAVETGSTATGGLGFWLPRPVSKSKLRVMNPLLVLLLIANLLACPLRCTSCETGVAAVERCDSASTCCANCHRPDQPASEHSAPTPEGDCTCQNCICEGAITECSLELPAQFVGFIEWVDRSPTPPRLSTLSWSQPGHESQPMSGRFRCGRATRIGLQSLLI